MGARRRVGRSTLATTALVLIVAGAGAGGGGGAARAEPPMPQIWDVTPGTPVGDLPVASSAVRSSPSTKLHTRRTR
jgi:hypothetical protein